MLGKIAAFAALVIVAIIFQTFFASLVSIDNVMPDIYVVLVIYLTLTQGLTYGVLFAFITGIIEGSADPAFLGLSAILKVLLALIVYFMSIRMRLESNSARILTVLIAVAVHNLLYYLIAYNFDIELTIYTSVKYALLEAIYSAVIAVILLYLAKRKLTLKFEA
ncbi:MAG: rod shape-determining protein MreD [candidate division Zixibacteria bacterium]|nr:rod shape-determining protein MreD [candidate division Zixibacteria bacterium]NIR68312.1 rod shape-determining protein MreD [candidate division Zixibacteria bacterium]NIS18293.1 rod shape-determining protein MreD [candidate division Zixibacteria bacterium]NIS49479.1 rod shape-determining protein MreD [candidate division Zixibacteria bacterium]NIT54616.1 rod shape-determining protein MreD [candidate division Zixibacteria bacterium]